MAPKQRDFELAPGSWFRRLSRANPEVVFRVFAVLTAGRETFITAGLRGREVEEVVRAVETDGDIDRLSFESQGPREAIIHISTQLPAPPALTRATRDPSMHPPIAIRDGVAIACTDDAFVDSTSRSPGPGRDVDLRSSTEGLTDRQSEVLHTAIDRGYYDTPRRCTLTDLAAELGIAKSTCSGILQRLESTVMHQYARTNRTVVPLAD